MRIFHMKEMNIKMVGRIIICFIVQYQRRPLLNDDLELQKMMFWRGCFIIQQSEDGVHGGGEEENMMEGWSFDLKDRRVFGCLQ